MSEKNTEFYQIIVDANEITNADEVLIENGMDTLKEEAVTGTIDFLVDELLADQSGWGDDSALIVDFVTSISDYDFKTDTHTLYGKSYLRNRLEAKSPEFSSYVENYFNLADLSADSYSLLNALYLMPSDEEREKYLSMEDGTRLFNSIFSLTGTGASLLGASTWIGILLDISQTVLNAGATVFNEKCDQNSLNGLCLAISEGSELRTKYETSMSALENGDFSSVVLDWNDLVKIYELCDVAGYPARAHVLDEYAEWRYRYDTTNLLIKTYGEDYPEKLKYIS